MLGFLIIIAVLSNKISQELNFIFANAFNQIKKSKIDDDSKSNGVKKTKSILIFEKIHTSRHDYRGGYYF